MNWKKFWLAALVVYVILRVTDFIIHGNILAGYYGSAGFRPEAEMNSYLWVFWVTSIVFSFFFTFIFTKGCEGKGVMEGVRYGFYVGMLMWFTGAYAQYVMYPISNYSLVWYWIILGVIQMILCGIAAALIYKPKGATA